MPDIYRDRTGYIVTLRQRIADQVSVPLDLDDPGTIEFAQIFAIADVASDVSQRAQVAFDAVSVETARGEALDAIVATRGLTRRVATTSRYTTQLDDAGPVTFGGGETVRGGGSTGQQTWTVISTGSVMSGGAVVIEATDAGPITLTSPASLTPVTTVPGLTSLSWTSGVDPAGQVGRSRETDAELIVRAERGGDGLVPDLLALEWVVAATAVSSSGSVAVTVTPAPTGDDQTQELVDTIGANVTGIATTGSVDPSPIVYTQPGGLTRSVLYSVGTAASPSVAITVVRSSGSSLSDAEITSGVEATVRAYYTTLGVGDDIVRAQIIGAALDADSVADVTVCTINGSGANYTISPTFTATLSDITVTVTT